VKNKNKKQKDAIAESKGNSFEHTHNGAGKVLLPGTEV